MASVCEHLRYDGPIGWYVADDGSNKDHLDTVMTALKESGGDLWGWHQTNRDGYGHNANLAWVDLEQKGANITLWLEDDWRLERPFDITPYVKLLSEQHQNTSMIRLGHMPVDLNLTSVGHDGRMYLNVRKSSHYAYSGNPHLKHHQFVRDYGRMPEGKNPGETEISYDHTFRNTSGSGIVWPLAIGDNPPFSHIGAEASYA